MKNILLVAIVLFLTSCFKTEKPLTKESKPMAVSEKIESEITEKPPTKESKPMSVSEKIETELKVTYITVTESRTSNGSTDPIHDYTSTYSYTPKSDESESLLNNSKVNGKASLREYLTALIKSDQEFLKSLELKPPNPNEKVEEKVDDFPRPVGGMNSDTTVVLRGPGWSISDKGPKFFLSSSEASKLARIRGQESTISGGMPNIPHGE